MSDASIRQVGDGMLVLEGEVDHLSGASLRAEGQRLVQSADASSVELSCAGVTRSTSVGPALLLALLRDAMAAGKTLSIRDLPDDMRRISEVCGMLDLLPLDLRQHER